MNKYFLVIFVALSLAPFVSVASLQERIPLIITLPMPLLNANGPTPIFGQHLEPVQDKPSVLLVPIGTMDLALHKTVTSKSKAILGDLSMVTDGDNSGNKGGWVELAAGIQWVQIDLQDESDIYAIQLWHYHFKTRIYSLV